MGIGAERIKALDIVAGEIEGLAMHVTVDRTGEHLESDSSPSLSLITSSDPTEELDITDTALTSLRSWLS